MSTQIWETSQPARVHDIRRYFPTFKTQNVHNSYSSQTGTKTRILAFFCSWLRLKLTRQWSVWTNTAVLSGVIASIMRGSEKSGVTGSVTHILEVKSQLNLSFSLAGAFWKCVFISLVLSLCFSVCLPELYNSRCVNHSKTQRNLWLQRETLTKVIF